MAETRIARKHYRGMKQCDHCDRVPIENLHLVSGGSLIAAGIAAYFASGIEMSLGWMVFGAMFISMSDIGEKEMPVEKKCCARHAFRRTLGYIGVLGSIGLLLFYLSALL